MLFYCCVFEHPERQPKASPLQRAVAELAYITNMDHGLPICSAKHHIRPLDSIVQFAGLVNPYFLTNGSRRMPRFVSTVVVFALFGRLATEKASNMVVSQRYRRGICMSRDALPFESCWPFSFRYQPIVPSRAHACMRRRALEHT